MNQAIVKGKQHKPNAGDKEAKMHQKRERERILKFHQATDTSQEAEKEKRQRPTRNRRSQPIPSTALRPPAPPSRTAVSQLSGRGIPRAQQAGDWL